MFNNAILEGYGFLSKKTSKEDGLSTSAPLFINLAAAKLSDIGRQERQRGTGLEGN